MRQVVTFCVGWVFQAIACGAVPSPEVEQCLKLAADKYQLNYLLLRSIAEQESGFNAQARATNTNGSTDHGLMQINGAWLPTLSKFGISRDDLYKPCVSADVGGWILHSNVRQLGLTWNAVGAYNASTAWKRVKYAQSVYQRIQRQLARSQDGTAVPSVQAAPEQVATRQSEAPRRSAMVVWEHVRSSAHQASSSAQREAAE